MSYLETTHNVYKEAALTPDVGLCCTTNPIWELPGLKIPRIMQEMNYGCGSTVHARDLTNNPKMLYVGVGGGMELLQFAYFNRNKGGGIRKLRRHFFDHMRLAKRHSTLNRCMQHARNEIGSRSSSFQEHISTFEHYPFIVFNTFFCNQLVQILQIPGACVSGNLCDTSRVNAALITGAGRLLHTVIHPK